MYEFTGKLEHRTKWDSAFVFFKFAPQLLLQVDGLVGGFMSELPIGIGVDVFLNQLVIL